MRKLKSLSIVFPFYNDAGTVRKAIDEAYKYGRRIADDLEVIAIHGGKSKDNTFGEIKKMKKKYKNLIIVDKTRNKESYAVIKHGFYRASKEWVFYTDGDLQYDLQDLDKLVDKQTQTKKDVINGFRTKRGDNIIRVFFGGVYRTLTKPLFKLPIRDFTCDFRLIRNSYLKKLKLETKDASILLEFIKKLEFAGAKFAEVKVNHYPRTYGVSTYTLFRLIKERILGDFITWFKIICRMYN